MEQGANDLHMVQLMPLPFLASLKSKVSAYPGCPGKEAIKWMFVL